MTEADPSDPLREGHFVRVPPGSLRSSGLSERTIDVLENGGLPRRMYSYDFSILEEGLQPLSEVARRTKEAQLAEGIDVPESGAPYERDYLVLGTIGWEPVTKMECFCVGAGSDRVLEAGLLSRHVTVVNSDAVRFRESLLAFEAEVGRPFQVYNAGRSDLGLTEVYQQATGNFERALRSIDPDVLRLPNAYWNIVLKQLEQHLI